MVVTLAGLVIVALLVLVGLKSMPVRFDLGLVGPPPVATADDGQAQQSLSTALTTAATASAASGSYAGVDAAALQAAEPTLTFVDGPSTGPTTVSVAAISDGSGSVTLAARASRRNVLVRLAVRPGRHLVRGPDGRGTCARPSPSGPLPTPAPCPRHVHRLAAGVVPDGLTSTGPGQPAAEEQAPVRGASTRRRTPSANITGCPTPRSRARTLRGPAPRRRPPRRGLGTCGDRRSPRPDEPERRYRRRDRQRPRRPRRRRHGPGPRVLPCW